MNKTPGHFFPRNFPQISRKNINPKTSGFFYSLNANIQRRPLRSEAEKTPPGGGRRSESTPKPCSPGSYHSSITYKKVTLATKNPEAHHSGAFLVAGVTASLYNLHLHKRPTPNLLEHACSELEITSIHPLSAKPIANNLCRNISEAPESR